MKRLFFLAAGMITAYSAYSQCPGTGNITANGKCIFISWPTEPARVPDSLKLKSNPLTMYRKVDSSPTGTSPFTASYRNNSPGGGACNASASDIPISDSTVMYTHSASGVDSVNCNYLVGVLPVTLLRFDGRHQGAYNELNWAVTQVSDFRQFVIEKSTGNTFRTIGSIDFRNGQDQYSFLDLENSQQLSCYRLRLTDLSGAYSYSPVIRLSGNAKGNEGLPAQVFPNPAGASATILLADPALYHTTVQLKSMDGRLLRSWTLPETAMMELPLNQLAAGMYLLQFSNGSTIRLIHQEQP